MVRPNAEVYSDMIRRIQTGFFVPGREATSGWFGSGSGSSLFSHSIDNTKLRDLIQLFKELKPQVENDFDSSLSRHSNDNTELRGLYRSTRSTSSVLRAPLTPR